MQIELKILVETIDELKTVSGFLHTLGTMGEGNKIVFSKTLEVLHPIPPSSPSPTTTLQTQVKLQPQPEDEETGEGMVLATEPQKATLRKFKICFDENTLTKDEASDLISERIEKIQKRKQEG